MIQHFLWWQLLLWYHRQQGVRVGVMIGFLVWGTIRIKIKDKGWGFGLHLTLELEQLLQEQMSYIPLLSKVLLWPIGCTFHDWSYLIGHMVHWSYAESVLYPIIEPMVNCSCIGLMSHHSMFYELDQLVIHVYIFLVLQLIGWMVH